MGNVLAFVFSLCLLCPGEMKEWPTHSICKSEHLELYYRSCDPFQDYGVSISPCDIYSHERYNMQLGLILRHNINTLRVNMKLFRYGIYILDYGQPICEIDDQRFSFCGRKKGEFVYIDHPFSIPLKSLPKGEYLIEMELFGEDKNISCVNLTLLAT
ncbi:lymphocyte antigen 86 isoform X1 [Spea bombifrons]|uniref:lymphocyte antigen 86 isoform X1 n=1 Tax=Spea bombifrons TaxID=233779 RepID=UPI00234AF5D2|nr:lymphocyte antigen 86 isoform X1 [Spea bombifrons]